MGQRKLYLQYYLDYCHYLWRRRLIASILVCLAILLYRNNTRKRKRAITYAPMIDRDIERLTHLNRLYNGTEAHCINELRMRKGVFHRLCDELRSRALLEETFHVTIEEQVTMMKSNDEITATMKSLRETLVGTAPPQIPQLVDPHAVLWQKLEAIPMTSDQRVLIGEHLSTKENKAKCGWLCNASAETLHAWVFKFLCEKEGITL